MIDTYDLLLRVRKERPLIHHITNWVTIYDCAQVVRVVGALPVMAHSKDEVEEMVSSAGALVLNIGTLTQELVDSMILAGKQANKCGIPIILDSVGAGATSFRTSMVKRIIKAVKVQVLKGNHGEIGTLAGVKSSVIGVESGAVSGDPSTNAHDLAKSLDLTVVITGKEDIVSNGSMVYIVKNGHEMMGRIVGTGCMASSVIGCFIAVEKDYAVAAASALSYYGIAGELAAKKSRLPCSYKTHFLDSLAEVTPKDIKRLGRII